jgi:hypothetical protein
MDSSNAGELMTYFSLAQFPRSSRRHRSLQNGKSAFVSESVGFRQIGQLAFTQGAYRKGLNGAAGHAGSQPARGLDPTESRAPFKITELAVLVLFVVLTSGAVAKFHPGQARAA